jgi:hypothetical protein
MAEAADHRCPSRPGSVTGRLSLLGPVLHPCRDPLVGSVDCLPSIIPGATAAISSSLMLAACCAAECRSPAGIANDRGLAPLDRPVDRLRDDPPTHTL